MPPLSPSFLSAQAQVLFHCCFFFLQELCPLHPHPGGGHCVGDAAGTHHGGRASWHGKDGRGRSDHQQPLPQLSQPANTAGHPLQPGPQPGVCACVYTCVHACTCTYMLMWAPIFFFFFVKIVVTLLPPNTTG